jgi:hypothetical protein
MFAGVFQHLLHFGDGCSRLAVGLLVVNPTAENHTQLADGSDYVDYFLIIANVQRCRE